MKAYLLTGLTILSLSCLVGCSSTQTEEAAPAPQATSDSQAAQETQTQAGAPSTDAANSTGSQEVNVKNPATETGNQPMQSPGGADAARTISPATQ